MRSHYFAHDARSAYYISAPIVEWLPVFNSQDCCNLLIRTLLDQREHKALQIHAWVLMEGHFQAILSAPDLSRILREFRKITGFALFQQIRKERREWLARQLAAHGVARPGGEHLMWLEGILPQAIEGEEMMLQRLETIHLTPVKRGYVLAPEHWRYSSAHEKSPGDAPLFEVDPWK